MKEQTPLEKKAEAKKWLRENNIDENEVIPISDGYELLSVILYQFAEAREKAKVLEALEREHQNLLDVLNKKPLKEWEDKNVVRNQVIGLIEQFHETEVKPKYKNKDESNN